MLAQPQTQPQKGVIHLIPLLIIIVLLLAVVFAKPLLTKLTPTPSPSPTAIPTQTPTPTPTPTSLASPKPEAKAGTPTATGTPKPTTVPVSGPPNSGYSNITVATEKGNFSAKVISIDLGGARMITDTANDNDCGTDCPVLTLSDFVSRNGGFAGINGTYFCPVTYPDCAGKTNSFDFPVYNTRLGKWINGGNLGWNGRSMFYTDGGGAQYLQNASGGAGGVNAGIVNYPGLLSNGSVQIDDSQSGLSDKQRAVGTKVGIGKRGSQNVLVVIAYNLNMQQFAYVFKALGADSAMNLDDGGSVAMWYGGYKAGPGRNIPNAIIFASK